MAKIAKSCVIRAGHNLRNISAKDAKYGFGRLIDLARAEPVTVEKHGRPVVVVLSIEEYERLREGANGAGLPKKRRARPSGKSGGSVKA